MKASIPIKLIFWASRIKGKQRGTSSRSSLRVYTMSFLATDDVAFAADEFTTPPTADSASARPPARAREEGVDLAQRLGTQRAIWKGQAFNAAGFPAWRASWCVGAVVGLDGRMAGWHQLQKGT